MAIEHEINGYLQGLKAAECTLQITDGRTGATFTSEADTKALIVCLSDPIGFLARQWGVSRDVYVQWVTHYREMSCTGTTKKGTRCQKYLSAIARDPGEFTPGIIDRCHLHQEY